TRKFAYFSLCFRLTWRELKLELTAVIMYGLLPKLIPKVGRVPLTVVPSVRVYVLSSPNGPQGVAPVGSCAFNARQSDALAGFDSSNVRRCRPTDPKIGRASCR